MTESRIKNIEIFLRNHHKADLRKLYRELYGEDPEKKWVGEDLIRKIAQGKEESLILEKWQHKFGVYNTSVTVQVLENSEKERQKNILAAVKEAITEEAWIDLTTKKKYPRDLRETRLLEVKEFDNKVYFLLAEKGRSKMVLNGFTLQSIVEPRFSILVWNDAEGIIEVRGQGRHDRVVKFVSDLLKWGTKYSVKTCYIDNDTQLLDFATKMSGEIGRVRLNNAPQSDIASMEMIGKPTKNVFTSAEYKDLKLKGFIDNAGGVTFKISGEVYVIWVGFKAKTLWLQKGSMDETILKAVVSAYLEHGTIER